jgi:hypothetical protein
MLDSVDKMVLEIDALLREIVVERTIPEGEILKAIGAVLIADWTDQSE